MENYENKMYHYYKSNNLNMMNYENKIYIKCLFKKINYT